MNSLPHAVTFIRSGSSSVYIAHQSQSTTGLDTSHFIRVEEHKKSKTKGSSYFSFQIFYSGHNKLCEFPPNTDISLEQNPNSCFWEVVLGTPEAPKGVTEVCKG